MAIRLAGREPTREVSPTLPVVAAVLAPQPLAVLGRAVVGTVAVAPPGAGHAAAAVLADVRWRWWHLLTGTVGLSAIQPAE